MFNKYKELFSQIGYTLVNDNMFYGKGYYIKPIKDEDITLNYKYIGSSLDSLKDSYEFTKEYYTLK